MAKELHKTTFIVTVYTEKPEWPSIVAARLREHLKNMNETHTFWGVGMFRRTWKIVKSTVKHHKEK